MFISNKIIRLDGERKKLHRGEKGGIGYYYRQFITAEGHNNCVPVAIAILHGVDYYEAIDNLLLTHKFRIAPRKGTFTREFISSDYGQGFENVYTCWKAEVKFTPAGFAAVHPKGKYLLQLRGHVVAIIDGTVFEFTWKKMPGRKVVMAWKLNDESVLTKHL